MGAGRRYQTQALKCFRATGSIPASAGSAASAATICSLTDAQAQRVMGYKICGQLIADGSDRPAIAIDAVEYVPAGTEFKAPTTDEFQFALIKAVANAAITASFVFYLSPGGD